MYDHDMMDSVVRENQRLKEENEALLMYVDQLLALDSEYDPCDTASYASAIHGVLSEAPYTSLAYLKTEWQVEGLRKAIQKELPRVSHVEYDSHAICKRYSEELLKHIQNQVDEEDNQ